MIFRSLFRLQKWVFFTFFSTLSTLLHHLGLISSAGKKMESAVEQSKTTLDQCYSIRKSKQFIRLKYEKTCYYLVGPPDGKLVVFMHGFSFFSFYWYRLASKLAENGYRVLLFDFYGQGESGICSLEQIKTLEETYGMEGWRLLVDQANELLSVLELKDQDELVVVGHSLGGLVATEFVRRRAQEGGKKTHLVLFNPVGMPTMMNWSSHFFSSFLQFLQVLLRYRPVNYLLVEGIGNLFLLPLSRLFPLSHDDLLKTVACLQHPTDLRRSLLPPSTRDMLNTIGSVPSSASEIGGGREKLRIWWKATWRRARKSLGVLQNSELLLKTWLHQMLLDTRRPLAFRTALRHFDFFNDFSQTYRELEINRGNTKVFLFWGEEDAIFPSSNLDAFCTCMPSAEVCRIQGADHSPFLQRPFEVEQKLLLFLSQPFPLI